MRRQSFDQETNIWLTIGAPEENDAVLDAIAEALQ